jgi:hypothetical protein
VLGWFSLVNMHKVEAVEQQFRDKNVKIVEVPTITPSYDVRLPMSLQDMVAKKTLGFIFRRTDWAAVLHQDTGHNPARRSSSFPHLPRRLNRLPTMAICPAGREYFVRQKRSKMTFW